MLAERKEESRKKRGEKNGGERADLARIHGCHDVQKYRT